MFLTLIIQNSFPLGFAEIPGKHHSLSLKATATIHNVSTFRQNEAPVFYSTVRTNREHSTALNVSSMKWTL